MFIARPLNAVRQVLVTHVRGGVTVARNVHHSAACAAAATSFEGSGSQQQQKSKRPGGWIGALLGVALATYANRDMIGMWIEGGTYDPIKPSYTPDGILAALEHNERETAKQGLAIERYPKICSLVERVNNGFSDAAVKVQQNTAMSAALKRRQQYLSSKLQSSVAAGAEGDNTSPEDRARYRQLQELLKGQLQATQQQQAALDRERKQLAALLSSSNLLGFTIPTALMLRCRQCQAALQQEHWLLYKELELVSNPTSASSPEELLATSRARQRDIKLARNRAMLAAYQEQRKTLEAVLRSPTERARKATMERIRTVREVEVRQRERLAAELAALEERSGRDAWVIKTLLRDSDGLLALLSEEEELASRAGLPYVPLLSEFRRFLENWTASAMMSETDGSIRALEREKFQVLTS